jgi:hypothetical protein
MLFIKKKIFFLRSIRNSTNNPQLRKLQNCGLFGIADNCGLWNDDVVTV